jgi:acylpyruvate hydrolase
MRLVSFVYRGETHIGAALEKNSSTIFDLTAAAQLPSDMTAFLQVGESAWARAQTALASAENRYLYPLGDVTLLAPVPHPGKIICVGHNYHGHTGIEPPTYPAFFAKWDNVVIGPNQPIRYPRFEIQLDYEGELAVVIGKRARYVAEGQALAFVAGYTIFNDVTARDYQNRTSQWSLGKSFDTFGPMGPALVTADEIPDPSHLDLQLTLNGKEMQHSNTSQLIFSVPFLISYLSQAMTLEPGDLISTGTPSGTGASFKPPVLMKPGDEVRIRIECIGELVNPIAAEVG